MIYPVILRSFTPAIVSGVITGNANSEGLKNPTDRILRVREIRFHMSTTANPGATITQTELALTEVQLRLGNNPISSQFVPLGAICEPIDLSGEARSTYSEGSGLTGPHVLRFRQPVLLAPGEAIVYSVRQTNGYTADLHVTAVCEDAQGKKGVTPWIAAWRSPAHTDGSGDFEDTSSESDLVNPFKAPLYVERFIGRLTVADIVINSGSAGMTRLGLSAVRVRLDDHRGRQIVRDPTPFSCMFDPIRRGWQVNSTLDARGFYRAYVDARLTTQVVSGAPASIQAIIGMLGYHAERR